MTGHIQNKFSLTQVMSGIPTVSEGREIKVQTGC